MVEGSIDLDETGRFGRFATRRRGRDEMLKHARRPFDVSPTLVAG